MNENKTNINCEKTIYRNFHKTIENNNFLRLRFLHVFTKTEKRRQNNVYLDGISIRKR